MAAFFVGYKEILYMLLNRGADVNVKSERYGGALQTASNRGYNEIVQLLLDRGADVNAQSERVGTALEAASLQGNKEIMQMLLGSGARVSIGDSRALVAAVPGGDLHMVQMLLNNMSVEDFDNELRMASSGYYNCDDEIMELLKTHDFPFRHKPSATEEA